MSVKDIASVLGKRLSNDFSTNARVRAEAFKKLTKGDYDAAVAHLRAGLQSTGYGWDIDTEVCVVLLQWANFYSYKGNNSAAIDLVGKAQRLSVDLKTTKRNPRHAQFMFRALGEAQERIAKSSGLALVAYKKAAALDIAAFRDTPKSSLAASAVSGTLLTSQVGNEGGLVNSNEESALVASSVAVQNISPSTSQISYAVQVDGGTAGGGQEENGSAYYIVKVSGEILVNGVWTEVPGVDTYYCAAYDTLSLPRGGITSMYGPTAEVRYHYNISSGGYFLEFEGASYSSGRFSLRHATSTVNSSPWGFLIVPKEQSPSLGGKVTFSVSGAPVSLSLGFNQKGESNGTLKLGEMEFSSFHCVGGAESRHYGFIGKMPPGVEYINSGAAMPVRSQYLSNQVLVDITAPNNNNGVFPEVKVYSASDVGAKDSSGFYTVTASPLQTITTSRIAEWHTDTEGSIELRYKMVGSGLQMASSVYQRQWYVEDYETVNHEYYKEYSVYAEPRSFALFKAKDWVDCDASGNLLGTPRLGFNNVMPDQENREMFGSGMPNHKGWVRVWQVGNIESINAGGNVGANDPNVIQDSFTSSRYSAVAGAEDFEFYDLSDSGALSGLKKTHRSENAPWAYYEYYTSGGGWVFIRISMRPVLLATRPLIQR